MSEICPNVVAWRLQELSRMDRRNESRLMLLTLRELGSNCSKVARYLFGEEFPVVEALLQFGERLP